MAVGHNPLNLRVVIYVLITTGAVSGNISISLHTVLNGMRLLTIIKQTNESTTAMHH